MDCGIADYEKAIRENRLGSSPSKLASLYSLEEGEIEKEPGPREALVANVVYANASMRWLLRLRPAQTLGWGHRRRRRWRGCWEDIVVRAVLGEVVERVRSRECEQGQEQDSADVGNDH